MPDHFQSLYWAKPKIEKRFKGNPRSSLSTMFRELRGSRDLDLIGDYPLVAFMVHTLQDMGIKMQRSKLRYALKQSLELKGQIKLVDLLLSGK